MIVVFFNHAHARSAPDPDPVIFFVCFFVKNGFGNKAKLNPGALPPSKKK